MDSTVDFLQESDIAAAMQLKNALGWNQTTQDWQRFIQVTPQGCFKLSVEEGLAGTAVSYVSGPAAWIGMVIVHPRYRGRGYGRALMEHCLAFCRRQGAEFITMDATEQGIPLYSRLGFEKEFGVGTVKGSIAPDPQVAPSLELFGPAVQIRELSLDDLPLVLALEAEAMGLSRKTLLERLLADFPGCALMGRSVDGEEGFVLYRPGHHSIQIGPLIACSGMVAAALLQTVFSRLEVQRPGPQVCFTVPLSHVRSRELLLHWGLEIRPRLTRMVVGRKPLARDEWVYALSGPEKG